MKRLDRDRWLPWVALGAGCLYLIAGFRTPAEQSPFHLNAFAKLPVLNGGRLKPLDTIARTALLLLSGKQTTRVEGHPRSAIAWLADVLYQPDRADQVPAFEIDDPDVLGAIGIEQTRQRRFSFSELRLKMAEIERLSGESERLKPEQRSRFQTAIANLQQRILLYRKLKNTLQGEGRVQGLEELDEFQTHIAPLVKAHLDNPAKASKLLKLLLPEIERYRFLDTVAEFYPLPLQRQTEQGDAWISMGRAILSRIQASSYHPGVTLYTAMGDAWRDGDSAEFNEALESYTSWVRKAAPREVSRSRFEFLFNYFAPFYRSMALYLTVLLLVFASWMLWRDPLNRSAFYLLVLAFAVHSAGLVSRMVLQGRPPVTNLYSSAIFVGWVAVALGIVLERLYRNGIGSMVASALGFMTLIIAHHLAASGDTLEMMRAVLDSNFWLATHVVCITIGYGSTFLSGFLAITYILRRAFDRAWSPQLEKTFDRMVYGIVCFSTLFSFIGTILGGIWADQSWGRFWGWDPKENGALLIVLWNVLILHARWGKLAEGRNLMILAVIGNIVTALSWFGVNMLGIGLHSYGFMDKAFMWLLLFIVSQLLLISLAVYKPAVSRRKDA